MGGRFSFTEMMWNKTPEFGASIQEKSKTEITVDEEFTLCFVTISIVGVSNECPSNFRFNRRGGNAPGNVAVWYCIYMYDE